MRVPRSLDVLHEPSFARYVAAATISNLGGGMAQVALAFAVLEFGTATDLGIVLLAREVPMIAFLLLGGVFADRLPRKALIAGGDMARGVIQLATAALLFSGGANVWNVALLQVGFGVVNAFSRPASIGFMRDVVRNERLQEANAVIGLSRRILSIAGPAIGALIVAAGSPAIAIAIDGLTFVVSAVLVWSMRVAAATRAVATSVVGDLRDGWREFISRPWAVAMIVSFGLFQLTFFPALYVLGPVVAKDSLGGPAAWGAVLALESAGAVIGGILALRLRIARPLIATQLFVLPSGLLLGALGVPLPLVVVAVVALMVGIGFAVGDTLWTTALQRNVAEHAISRISSYDWFGSIALNPIGYALIGPLSESLGIPATLMAAGALNIVVCLSVVLVPSVRHVEMRGAATS
jgi:MFS family permease